MAKKANGMNVKNKTQPQEARGITPIAEAALFCLVNEMQLLANFFKSLDFLVLFDQAKRTFKYFNVNSLTKVSLKPLYSHSIAQRVILKDPGNGQNRDKNLPCVRFAGDDFRVTYRHGKF